MKWLQKRIETIDKLFSSGDHRELLYATLECRLALELICYERLRNSRSYISDRDLRGWRPADVINTLLQEVDPHSADTFTLSISTDPVANKEDLDKASFQIVGKQVGFDPKLLTKMWNALGGFLHEPLWVDPEQISNRSDDIRSTLNKVISEIRRISEGSLISNGIGKTISFNCSCGSTIRRRSDLLADGKIISCLNKNCYETFVVRHLDGEIFVERMVKIVSCPYCHEKHEIPNNIMEKVPANRVRKANCSCGGEFIIGWTLESRPS